MSSSLSLTRREFIQGAGALMISFAMPIPGLAAASAPGPFPAKVPIDRLESWIVVNADGTVTAAVGKIEAGMGISTAFAQIVAEELDVPLANVRIRMGDTATTPDQRGTGSSNGIVQGVPALRSAAAQAREALLALAAERLKVPVDRLTVADGTVRVSDAPDRSVAYGELLAGKRLELKLSGDAKPKAAGDYRLVGKPTPRIDVPLKVRAEYTYLVDHKLPGMLHARVIRPPHAGARLVEVPPQQKLAGLVKIVARGDYLAVICEREEQAIRAARELRVQWSEPAAMFPTSYEALYAQLRSEKPKVSEVAKGGSGDVEAALKGASAVVEADYEYPFQSHASMGPGCAVADVKGSEVRVWSGGQKPYPLRKAIAEMLGRPIEAVRVTWMPGPGSYGMNDADDAAMDAAILSQAAGRPVRVQYMRQDGTGWDPKAPPIAFRLRGALVASGDMLALDYEARGYSGRVRANGTDVAGDTISAQLIGGYKAASTDLFQYSDESYRVPHKRKTSHIIAWEKSLPTGLRTAHLRDPDGMATCFASESFIDELAHAAKMDPVAFRLKHLSNAKHAQAVKAVAERAGWEARPSPKDGPKQGVVTGRGIAYAPRGGSIVATVAEVAVNMETGVLRVTRFVVAHDCGFVINPLNLRGTIEANLMQSMSRAMHEAVQFDEHRVTSVDWVTYPIVDMTEIPDAVDIVVLNNMPEQESKGAGEPSTRPTAAAIANAIFDATGVRIRRVPFTAEALQQAFRTAVTRPA
ncbi:MAG: molybdopterin-dependent oxidoreductase [Pseudomonadota bacterium]|nr:molybdopterin-dependent oxidoreductase [Pseudomonadota bacterium]